MYTRDKFLEFFRRSANGLAIRYGGPVFLVGGACTGPANDWDIVCVLSHESMRRNFGESYGEDGNTRTLANLYDYAEWEHKLAYYEMKVNRIMSKRFGVTIDFKVQSVKEAYSSTHKGKPSIRCDSLPDHFFK